MYSLVLLAGGRGTRMRNVVPKQFLIIGGRPIIVHVLERVNKIEEIDEIIVVCDPLYNDSIHGYTKTYGITKAILTVSAGKTRQESAYNGLCAARSEHVIIHEAARPFVTISEFTKLIESEAVNATYGLAIPFTVAKAGSFITGEIDRNAVINVQLPQKFRVDTLLAAHRKAIEEEALFTDDSSLLFHYTESQIKVLPGSSYNIKITEPVDLLLGETIYQEYILGGHRA